MTDPQVLSRNVDHIPVVWAEPENYTTTAHLVIWMDGLTGNVDYFNLLPATFSEE